MNHPGSQAKTEDTLSPATTLAFQVAALLRHMSGRTFITPCKIMTILMMMTMMITWTMMMTMTMKMMVVMLMVMVMVVVMVMVMVVMMMMECIKGKVG